MKQQNLNSREQQLRCSLSLCQVQEWRRWWRQSCFKCVRLLWKLASGAQFPQRVGVGWPRLRLSEPRRCSGGLDWLLLPPQPECCTSKNAINLLFCFSTGVSAFAKVTRQVINVTLCEEAANKATTVARFEKAPDCFFFFVFCFGGRIQLTRESRLLASLALRCLSLAPHPRPSPSAPDCWNTRPWRGCLHWRRARTPSSTSCVSPTPACPAAENCHSSSISVPSVSLAPPLLRGSGSEAASWSRGHRRHPRWRLFVPSSLPELSIQPQLNSTLIPPHARAQTSPASHGSYRSSNSADL